MASSLAVSTRLLLCSTPANGHDTRAVLEQAGWQVETRIAAQLEPEQARSFDLLVLDGGIADRDIWRACRCCRASLTDCFVPILATTSDPAVRMISLEAGADACFVRPFDPGELQAQVQAFLRLKKLHDRVRERTSEFHRANKRLRQAYRQVDQELDLARRIQQSLLPRTLPQLPGALFAVHYRPCGRVGGDFYDAFRLDETHAGFYVADVVGHGVPASLLTMFLKKAVRAKEIVGSEYRLTSPDEVLHHLNREMLEQALAENPFITMVYGLYNTLERTLAFARAGHPYPLLIPAQGEPRFMEVHGTLLGVFETEFVNRTEPLQPGDKVLFYTDGLETADVTAQSLLSRVPKYRDRPIDDLVALLADDLVGEAGLADDLTLLGLEVLT
ncbi:MAG TPA: SpoIIE family protein phosphatase [Gemmataceae bacterium]|jgi:sigma-B regulation protein RsbU (phosphoserine phosphatase)|nr:SpoIIE family protein phosphatase [Gemmataceae bacterium]